jgi:hypothetical protein
VIVDFVMTAEERFLVLVRHIHFAEQDGVAHAAGDEVADVTEVLVGVEDTRVTRSAVFGEEEQDGVDAEARDAQLEPEAKCP